MAVTRRPFARARKLAREMLWECGMDEPSKVDPLILVGRLRIQVVYGRLDGATARIFRNEDRAIMRISDQIVQVGRERFTVSHETGHHLCGHRLPTEVVLDANAPAPFSKHQEREADTFATEFLMPEAWVSRYCAAPAAMSSVREIADAFRVSLVAAGIRYVELTLEPCALVYSKHGRVIWARHSRSFPARIPPHLPIGAGAIACEDHSPRALEVGPRAVASDAWFGNAPSSKIGELVVEDAAVVPEPGWGGVLSILSVVDSEQSLPT